MNRVDDTLLRERVASGAEYLDEVYADWAATIDVDTLDLNGCDECVLGQLFGGFRDGMEQLGLTLSVTRVLGFNYEARSNGGWNGNPPGSVELERDEAERLRTFWLAEIERRTS